MDTDATGQLGVNIVERLVLQHGWVFRPQYVSDQGIDAQVETKEAGVTTGRLLALQIKAGPSWFKEPYTDGWIFRFNERQARLWLGHALPVIVVLVDVETGAAYWQQIDHSTAKLARTRYRVNVPRSQKVEDASAAWAHLASGIEARAMDRYEIAMAHLSADVREYVEQLGQSSRKNAAVLALHLADGRSNPAQTVRALLTAQPPWISHSQAAGWRAVAAYAQGLDAHLEASQALELAAEEDAQSKGRLLTGAGLILLEDDTSRAAELFDMAEEAGAPLARLTVARALLRHPDHDARPFDVSDDEIQLLHQASDDALVLNFLAEQAGRQGDPDTAIQLTRSAIQVSKEASGLRIRLAQRLVQRNSTGAGTNDRDEARSLLEAVVNERRLWGADTLEALDDLLRILALQGDFDAMLKASTAAPLGSATPEEANSPLIARHAVAAAYFLGREDLVPSLAEQLDDGPEARLIRARAGLVQLDPEELIALLTQVLDRSEAEADYPEMARTVLQLAQLGIDASDRLAPLIDRGIAPQDMKSLTETVARARTDLSAALPDLRVLAGTNTTAAEMLITLLSDAERHEEAAHAADTAYRTLRQGHFLLLKADSLLDAGLLSEAETAAREALAAVDKGFPHLRGRLFTAIAGACGDRGEWTEAEQNILSAIAAVGKPSPGDVWRLVTTQIGQGDLRRGAKTIRHHHVAPRNEEEGWYWLQCMATQEWNSELTAESLQLALQFQESAPRLSVALLTHIISATNTNDGIASDPVEANPTVAGEADAEDSDSPPDFRPAVPAELHRQAFAALGSLIDTHGEATGIRKLEATSDESAAQMVVDMLKDRATGVREAVTLAQEGRAPFGAIASLLGKSYALTLVQRALGVQLAGSPGDSEHDQDINDALSSLGSAVVVEASSLMLLSQLHKGSQLIGQFTSLQLPTSAKLDILRATVEVRGLAASGATVSWDHEREGVVIQEANADDYSRSRARAEALEALSSRTISKSVTTHDVFPEWEDRREHGPWMDSVQAAVDEGLPLWSDDVALRRLARSVGVRTFGTPALTEALSQAAIAAPEESVVTAAVREQQEWVREFVREFVVDVPAHLDDVLAQAQDDGWQPLAGAAVFSRASWWAWQLNPIADMFQIYKSVLEHNPGAVPGWRWAAMEGIRKAYREPDIAAAMLAVVALLPYAIDADSTEVVRGCREARRIANRYALADPIGQSPLAVKAMAEMGYLAEEDGEQLIQAVSSALSEDALV